VTSSAGVVLIAPDPDTTRSVGAIIASHLRPGDVVALSGELGAGKTCLVQGAAAALEVPQTITSPTFVLVKTYTGRLPVVHVDVYRLNHLQEVHDLGDDVFAPDAVTFVEWGDAITAALPRDHLEVEVVLADPSGGDTSRLIHLRPHGGWHDRVDALVEATAALARDPADTPAAHAADTPAAHAADTPAAAAADEQE
jgi:tRNA threonylcarbamoyladenosine biosynthesis protein TsaE